MLSYHATGSPHARQAEPGRTSERLSGMRAAATFRKLPSARPGAKRRAARAASIRRGSGPARVAQDEVVDELVLVERLRADVDREVDVQLRQASGRDLGGEGEDVRDLGGVGVVD